MASREEELQELAELEELERLEAEERAASPIATVPHEVNPIKDREGNLVRGAGTDIVPAEPWKNMLEGVGSGMVRAGRGAVNLGAKAVQEMPPAMVLRRALGLPNDLRVKPPKFASDEAILEQDNLDKPLSGTAAGALGQTVGQTALLAPVGGAPRASGAALEAMPALARTLAGPTARSALEGAVSGAATGDPTQQGAEAVKSALIGGALTKGGQALKRTVGGLGKTSEAADHLEQFAEQHGKNIFIPAAQAISDESDIPSRLVKTLYKDLLPVVPGVSGQIKSQGKRLVGDVREMALKEADFKGVLTPDDIANPEQSITKLQKVLDDEYKDTIKAYSFRVDPNFRDHVKAKIVAASPDVDDVTLNKVATMLDEKLARYSSNKSSLVGENLLHAKNAMSDEIRGLKGTEKQAGIAAMGAIEDMIEKRLNLGNSPIMKADLARYKALNDPYSAFVAARDATKKAAVKKGEFTPAQLVRSAKRSGTQKLLGQVANEVTSESLGAPSAAGRIAGYTALGALGGFGSPVAAGGVVAGGNALATEMAQDILMGRTGGQQALIEALRNNPKKMRVFGTVGRTAATVNGGDE